MSRKELDLSMVKIFGAIGVGMVGEEIHATPLVAGGYGFALAAGGKVLAHNYLDNSTSERSRIGRHIESLSTVISLIVPAILAIKNGASTFAASDMIGAYLGARFGTQEKTDTNAQPK